MLNETKRDLINYASLLPEIEVNGKKTRRYEDYDITDLANSYCDAKDAGDERKIGIYLSALMLRFWYQLDKMYQKCKTAGVEREDLFNTLYECIEIACDYRAWRKNPKLNAQACINQAIATRGVAAIMYRSNLKKNALKIQTLSLDAPIDGTDPNSDTYADQFADVSTEDNSSQEAAIGMVQTMIDNNKLVEAIILDNIAFKDCYKHEKKTYKELNWEGKEVKRTKYESTFWPFKLVKELNELDEDYVNYFLDTYAVELRQFNAAFDSLMKTNNSTKYKIIDASLATARTVLDIA